MNQREFRDIIDKGIRGCICRISRKYTRANNKYILEEYDSKKITNYIVYLDCSNLYGTAMTQPMPECDFAFMPQDEMRYFDYVSVSDDSPVAYF